MMLLRHCLRRRSLRTLTVPRTRRPIFTTSLRIRHGVELPGPNRTQTRVFSINTRSMTEFADAMPINDDSKSIIRSTLVDVLGEMHPWFHNGQDSQNSDIDVNRPDENGRLLLHALCAAAWCELPDSRSLSLQESADYLIPRTQNVDTPDIDGVRPLHLAAMMSEWLVKRLLAAGADAEAGTSEGLTSLHLAARAREANIIGMLIEELKNKSSDGDIQTALDARDNTGRTALFYACRSGRPESVSLLLDAGADVHVVDNMGFSLFDACTEYEEEQRLWVDWKKPDLDDYDLIGSHYLPVYKTWYTHAEGGVKTSDTLRPWVSVGRILNPKLDSFYKGLYKEVDGKIMYPDIDRSGDSPPRSILVEVEEGKPKSHQEAQARRLCCEHDTTRLEEILRRLFEEYMNRGTELVTLGHQVDICIERCKSNDSQYSMRCLQYLKLDAGGKLGQLDQLQYKSLLERENNVLSTHVANPSFSQIWERRYLVEWLLRQREYRVIKHVLRETFGAGFSLDSVEANPCGYIQLFVKHGFGDLLKFLLECDRLQETTLDSWFSNDAYYDPLVYQACQRELPNMEVIRVLVENGHSNVNAQSRTGENEFDHDVAPHLYLSEDEIDRVTGRNTALHEVAKGCHWWQVSQALPYLLSVGADKQKGNEDGATPLDLSLTWRKRYVDFSVPETFAHEARALLQEG